MTTSHRDQQTFLNTTRFSTEAGSHARIKTASESIACSGATSSASNLIPDGAFVLGVTARVTELVAGATSFTIGDGTDADKWGAGIALAAGTKTSSADFTAGPSLYTSATSVVLTGTGGSFSDGTVLVTVHYIDLAAL